jgi:uncharacterized protein with NRDE domain
MCVLAIAWRAHPRWRLIAAGNRDELHARPASPLAHWERPDHLIAGTDLRSGGTWLGISEQGRFAVVTNLRGYGLAEPDRPSRGALVTDILAGEGRYADPDEPALMAFNPFNLITVDGERALFLSNRPGPIRQTLPPGLYGLSNGALDEPWPKTVRLKAILRDWVAGEATQPELLLDGLREDVLPDTAPGGVVPSDIPQEPAVSPIFIRHPVYGTRCSTVVAIDERGDGLIVERRYTPSGDAAGETRVPFTWSAP